MENKEKPKYQDAVLAYSNATLGISIVVAVLIGVGIGYGLENLFGYRWLFGSSYRTFFELALWSY